MKVAIVIGHRIGSQGESNKRHAVTEFTFNERLAFDISKQLTATEMPHEIIYRESYKGLPKKINSVNPTHILSLHCNGFDGTATGTETLYYHSSQSSKDMAELFQKSMCESLGLKDRGILPRHSEDRGGYLLKETIAPCVILEPFFIDNNSDYDAMKLNYDSFIAGIVLAIHQL